MKNKLKVLSYYFSMMILSIVVLGLSLTTLLKFTIFDDAYLIKHLEKTNYYNELYSSIIINQILMSIFTTFIVYLGRWFAFPRLVIVINLFISIFPINNAAMIILFQIKCLNLKHL